MNDLDDLYFVAATSVFRYVFTTYYQLPLLQCMCYAYDFEKSSNFETTVKITAVYVSDSYVNTSI